jgi:hypothetical protein
MEDPRLSEIAFECVAEHYAAVKKRFKLIEMVRAICTRQSPVAVHLDIAAWGAPALFYVHFDGLMEAAYQQRQRIPTTVYRLTAPADARQGDMLILVRGTINDTSSLILTEREREGLEFAIDNLPASIEQITTREIGRSVVLLGVSPRDPVVRRLAKKLITPRANQDTSFFISADFTEADEAYWSFLGIRWIRADAPAAVAVVTDFIRGGG